MEQIEIWKDVVGFEGLYMVSSIGRVKSLDRMTYNNSYKKTGKILKNGLHKHGYPKYTLCKEGKLYYTTSHQLVAKAFLPNPNNFNCINHIDNNPKNNHFSNLEWCTSSHNSIQAYKCGNLSRLGEKNSMCKITSEQALYIFNYNGDKSILEKQLNISRQTINDIKLGRRWYSVTGKRHKSVKKRICEQ